MNTTTVVPPSWSAEQRRTRIIEAASTLFASKGLNHTTVEEIAIRGNVEPMAVYDHFGSLEGLYAVVINQVVTGLLTALREAMTKPVIGSHETIESTVQALFDFIEDCPHCMQLIVMDFSEHGGFSAPSILSDTTAQVEFLLQQAYAVNDADPKSIPLVAQALTGMVAIVGQWWLVHPEFTKDEVVTQLVQLAWDGIHRVGIKST